MKRLLLFVLFSFLIPIIISGLYFNYKVFKIISGFNHNESNKSTFIRVLKKDNSIETMDIEEYLVGVVASEMPVYFEEEALKAQAVASRTYALKQMENNKDRDYDVTDDTSYQVYQSNEDLKNKWGSNYDEYYNKIKNIVEKTRGEYISYNDDFIYAFFFSTSNGYTEDNVNVFGSDLPYLKPVISDLDKEENENYEYSISINKEEFYSKLGIEYSNKLYIDNIKRTSSNRVLSLEVNGNMFKGREFQKLLSLRSNDFDVLEEDNSIIIKTRGFGHGVGLSQYGSNGLAKKNKTYIEILKYYYQGTEIKKL